LTSHVGGKREKGGKRPIYNCKIGITNERRVGKENTPIKIKRGTQWGRIGSQWRRNHGGTWKGEVKGRFVS